MHPPKLNWTLCKLVNSHILAAARVPLSHRIKKPIRLTLTNCTAPFEVSAYDKTAYRKSLDVRASDELQDFCKRIDASVLKYAATLTCTEGGIPVC